MRGRHLLDEQHLGALRRPHPQRASATALAHRRLHHRAEVLRHVVGSAIRSTVPSSAVAILRSSATSQSAPTPRAVALEVARRTARARRRGARSLALVLAVGEQDGVADGAGPRAEQSPGQRQPGAHGGAAAGAARLRTRLASARRGSARHGQRAARAAAAGRRAGALSVARDHGEQHAVAELVDGRLGGACARPGSCVAGSFIEPEVSTMIISTASAP